ncbi:hypothetical protein NSMS1_05500 [Nostoc sp. MS1]|nr:hypothetical protein NSMS1_05500 [Nostoc sp. MS1]
MGIPRDAHLPWIELLESLNYLNNTFLITVFYCATGGGSAKIKSGESGEMWFSARRSALAQPLVENDYAHQPGDEGDKQLTYN